MTTGPGLYFDGTSSARHPVTVMAAPESLRILGPDGMTIASWPYADLRSQSAPDDVMRLRRANAGPELARLEIRDAALIAAIDAFADSLDRSGATERRLRRHVIGWAVAAMASLVLMATIGLPMLAEQITPLIPISVEQRLGTAIDAQVRGMLDNKKSDKPFECGTTDAEKPGRAALDELVGRLAEAAHLPIPLSPAVVRRRETNAIALPGGHIYVFEGLIAKANSAEEVASVVAHEIGHVAHRDGTRSLLEAAGLSFMFGMMLGDFTGGGLVVIAAKTVVQSSYSREVETAADGYGVNLMAKAGSDPRALAVILDRIAGSIEPPSKILADHPQTKDRVKAINAAADRLPAATRPLLAPAQWTALKAICE